MIFNMVGWGGGAKKVGITINGAVNEVVYYSGASSGSIQLNEHGNGVLNALPAGDYTFSGSVSGYVKAAIVDKNTSVVNVYPNSALFWYGNGDSVGDSLYHAGNKFVGNNSYYPSGVSVGKTMALTVTAEENAIALDGSSSDKDARVHAAFYLDREINLEGYSTIRVDGEGMGSVYSAQALKTAFAFNGNAAIGDASVAIAPYLVAFYSVYGSYMTMNATIKAIWLE